MVTVAKWDAAEVLTSPERIAAYLEVVLEDDDPEALKVALGNIARAKDMAEIRNLRPLWASSRLWA